jgi:hypothetical protein
VGDNKECSITDVKVSDIESAITRLVTIQEIQTKQTDKMMKSIDNFSHISKMVEQNTNDINKLGIKLAETTDKIHVKETKMSNRLDNQRKELDTLGQGRLWKGLSTGVAVTLFAFGYFYTDMHLLILNMDEARMTQQEIKSSIKYIQKEITDVITFQKSHSISRI